MQRRINFDLLKRFWSIARLYWFSEEKRKARGLLLGITLMLITYTVLSVLLNQQRGGLITALSELNEEEFWQKLLIYFGVLVAYIPLFAGANYLSGFLGLLWRKWLTGRFLDNYFRDRAYYKLSSYGEIDNPDQRISQDLRSFTQESLDLLLVTISSILQVIGFGIQLWTISFPLVIFLVIYAIIGTLITIGVFGKVLVRLNFQQLKREANFRFGLVRIRENAESIAFYQGEPQEENQVKVRFNDVFENFKRLILWQKLGLRAFTNSYEFITFAIPFLILAPSVFAGDLQVGKVTEAQGAFFRIFMALNLIVNRFETLTEFSAGINRVHEFANYINLTDGDKKDSQESDKPTIGTVNDEQIAVKNLTLQTPNYQRTLVENLTVDVPQGNGLLIMGASGCGKSSLLRAIAGLWESGTGKIIRPNLSEILFLPQRPYMILGSLREELIYPKTETELTNDDLGNILDQVNLPHLIERFGSLEVEKNWGDVLSLGEQQRVAFARILINQPRYVVLDEATSALDVKNEASLYENLQSSNVTYISVGHRPTLQNYHQLVLELAEDQSWQIKQTTAQ
ncbi:MAG: ABC transporter ATP-binding protein [Cyanobacteria bacterium SW_9_44_58]|nr:MAG: ABC transporter ATP-binding protein [Cyanobacteria bacterium SW_9_44_58]